MEPRTYQTVDHLGSRYTLFVNENGCVRCVGPAMVPEALSNFCRVGNGCVEQDKNMRIAAKANATALNAVSFYDWEEL